LSHYVDDLIVKSSSRANHVSDLAETFANMRRAGLKLNPEKCVFGVTKGIREMEEPKTKKDI
jgi:hypothetical protein